MSEFYTSNDEGDNQFEDARTILSALECIRETLMEVLDNHEQICETLNVDEAPEGFIESTKKAIQFWRSVINLENPKLA